MIAWACAVGAAGWGVVQLANQDLTVQDAGTVPSDNADGAAVTASMRAEPANPEAKPLVQRAVRQGTAPAVQAVDRASLEQVNRTTPSATLARPEVHRTAPDVTVHRPHVNHFSKRSFEEMDDAKRQLLLANYLKALVELQPEQQLSALTELNALISADPALSQSLDSLWSQVGHSEGATPDTAIQQMTDMLNHLPPETLLNQNQRLNDLVHAIDPAQQ